MVLARCGSQDISVIVIAQDLNCELSDRRRPTPYQNWSVGVLGHIVLGLWPRRLQAQIRRDGMKHGDKIIWQRYGLRKGKSFWKLTLISIRGVFHGGGLDRPWQEAILQQCKTPGAPFLPVTSM